MKNYFIKILCKLIFLLLISSNVFSVGDESDSFLLETLDEVLIDDYKPCSDQNDFDSVEINDVSSFMILSGDASFNEGDEIISSNNARAIVSSFDKDINKLSYYQNAKTGFKSFALNARVAGPYKGISFIKEFVFDFVVPCSDLIVSLEESPQQMFFVFTESNEVIKSKLAAQEMMAEIKVEMARQAALDAFLKKLVDEKAAAAASTAAFQQRLKDEELVAQEIAAFEAQLEAELASQEMMAEIKVEMARQAALDAFLKKLADDKAAAAKSTAAYQSKRANDARTAALMAELTTEQELAAFEAKLAAELASQEMMAEIEAEMARKAALDAFQAKLADEKAAAAASTAAYQAKLAYDMRVNKIMDDLIIQLDEIGITDDYKSTIADELINEATRKLEDEKFLGIISGEIVTVAIHNFCKVNLGLSDSNIELFKKALEGGYLGNVGPQVTNGTEFSSNRWDDYIDCVGSKRI